MVNDKLKVADLLHKKNMQKPEVFILFLNFIIFSQLIILFTIRLYRRRAA